MVAKTSVRDVSTLLVLDELYRVHNVTVARLVERITRACRAPVAVDQIQRVLRELDQRHEIAHLGVGRISITARGLTTLSEQRAYWRALLPAMKRSTAA